MSHIARDIGVSESALRKWVRQTDIDEGNGPEGALTTEERAELNRRLLWLGGRIPWAELCQFTFSEDVKQCPKCGGTLTIIAAISMIQYELIEKVLRHLKLPVDFSEPSPAQYASQLDLDFDQDLPEEQDEVWGQDEDRAGDPRGPP